MKQMSLFDDRETNAPLASRLRPSSYERAASNMEADYYALYKD